MDLTQYERTKFELAEALRLVQALCEEPGDTAEERIRELFVRLAEDRFNLVVVGRFSRGKSSVMNALLGVESLPIGVVPLTSVITSVFYGTRPGVTIRYKNRQLGGEVPIEALSDFVTQHGNPGNVRQVAAAEVRLPAELLRRGFHFVDTPGLGSTIAENTRTTQEFLPQADAFVLVTSYESALSSEEFAVLQTACASARRVFVVLNKQDLLPPGERGEVQRYLAESLAALPAETRPLVFSASARDALQARRAGDTENLAASGIPELEAELVRFLVAEKSVEFLLRQCDRAAELARTLLPDAGSAPVIARIDALAASISARPLAGATRTSVAAGHASLDAPRVLESCEVCRAILGASFDFLRRFQYDVSADPGEQARHAQRGGLCPRHTWEYAALASTHGIATGYPALLERLAAEFCRMRAGEDSPQALGARIRGLLPSRERCVVCLTCARAEEHALAALARRFGEDAQSAAGSLSAVCLPHLGLLIARLEDPRAIAALSRREARILERFSEDMRRYATKHDAVRRNLASEEELRAARTALAALAGLRNVNLAPAPD
ncbi:MAG: dynamin family protein [Betaproteobacteria bacterium]|nr:dynamin family protein [Betaproteobacteria bacterium]